MTEREILKLIVDRFRWKDLHYDQQCCPSCGAISSFDYETGKRKRIDQCSPSCIWRKAEEILDNPPTPC